MKVKSSSIASFASFVLLALLVLVAPMRAVASPPGITNVTITVAGNGNTNYPAVSAVQVSGYEDADVSNNGQSTTYSGGPSLLASSCTDDLGIVITVTIGDSYVGDSSYHCGTVRVEGADGTFDLQWLVIQPHAKTVTIRVKATYPPVKAELCYQTVEQQASPGGSTGE